MQDLKNEINLNITNSEESFKDFRRFLNEDNNLIGVSDWNGIRFHRKYIRNVKDLNIRLYYTNVRPVEVDKINIIANLCIVHGFGHYSGEFYELAYLCSQNGINCHLIDLRGHGFSGGIRFDWTVDELQTDVLTLIKECEMDGVDLPTFMFGHSMGGGLVSSFFINNQYLQLNGVILSSPLLGFPMNANKDIMKRIILNRIGNDIREFVLHGNINPTELCKDEREVARIINDKRVIPLASPRAFRSLLKNCERILENCRYFNLPCLILHGNKDKLCNIDDSKFFINNIKSSNKELYTFHEGYHEIYLDYEKDEFINKVIKWIDKMKDSGKTDKPFPIDIKIGPPNPIYNKIKLSFIFKLICFLIYFYIAYKIKPIIKGKLARLTWPISIIHYLYKSITSY